MLELKHNGGMAHVHALLCKLLGNVHACRQELSSQVKWLPGDHRAFMIIMIIFAVRFTSSGHRYLLSSADFKSLNWSST
jgi:hypothetical protein